MIRFAIQGIRTLYLESNCELEQDEGPLKSKLKENIMKYS
jgi:hypothetical protein